MNWNRIRVRESKFHATTSLRKVLENIVEAEELNASDGATALVDTRSLGDPLLHERSFRGFNQDLRDLRFYARLRDQRKNGAWRAHDRDGVGVGRGEIIFRFLPLPLKLKHVHELGNGLTSGGSEVHARLPDHRVL